MGQWVSNRLDAVSYNKISLLWGAFCLATYNFGVMIEKYMRPIGLYFETGVHFLKDNYKICYTSVTPGPKFHWLIICGVTENKNGCSHFT